MPRKSTANLSIVPAQPIPSAPVPRGLSAAEKRTWREVVESKPSDWFGADSWPVLKEYVRACAMCDTLAVMVKDALASEDADKIRDTLDMQDKVAKRLAGLATKLRLTQQSRYTPQAAATADKRASGKRPWQSAAG